MRKKLETKSSYFTYHKKEADTDTSEDDRLLDAPIKIDTLCYPNITQNHKPIIEGKYRVTRYTRAILIIMEHKEYEI